jgi:uncharacterized membrane protein YGL010W
MLEQLLTFATPGQRSHTHVLRSRNPYHCHSIRTSKHPQKNNPEQPLKPLQATNTPSIPTPPYLTIPNLPANLGTIAGTLYTTLYLLMEPVAGAMLAPLLLGGTAWANYLTSTYGAKANYIALGVHLTSWIAQFIGHGVFEGRAPALLDNLVQALFLAPFFVWLEVLFMCGYRPDLKARLDESVEREVEKFRSGEDAKSKNSNGSVNGSANGKVIGNGAFCVH